MTRAKDISKILTDADISGNIDVDGVTNLDVVDIDGAVDMASTLQVDGAITSSAGMTITTTDNSDNLTLTSTLADSDVAPNLRLYRNSGSPADDDQIGKVQFEGRNDNSQDVIYTEIINQIKDASDGTEDGRMALNTMVAGTLASSINILPEEIVINDSSKDRDFRVESDGNANMFFVDAGNNRVGIGTSSPSNTLEIKSTANDDGIRLSNAVGSYYHLVRSNGDGLLFDADAGSGGGSGADIRFQVKGSEKARIDSSGRFLLGTNAAISSAGGAIFQQSQSNNNWTQYVENSASSGSVYGQLIKFTGQSPDNLVSAFLSCVDSSNTKFIIYSDGDAYNHDGTFAQLSDRRIKDNITDANSQWEDIKAMRFVNYQRKDDIRQYGKSEAKVQLGLIGQELEKVSPNLVREVEPNASDILGSSEFGTLYENGDTIPEDKNIGDVKEVKDKVKGVAYSILYMKAVKALQEAMTRIETLEAKVTALESA